VRQQKNDEEDIQNLNITMLYSCKSQEFDTITKEWKFM